MKRFLVVALLALVAIAATACGGGAASAPKSRGDTAKGKTVFASSCSACNGADAKGLLGLGKDMTTSAFVKGLSEDQFPDFLKKGTGLEIDALLAKGELQREQGNYRAALATLDQARERAGSSPSPAIETTLHAATALSHEVQGKLREAQEAWERVRELAATRGDAPAVPAATAGLGALRVRTGDHERARTDLESALEMHRRLAVLNERLAWFHRDHQGTAGPAAQPDQPEGPVWKMPS